MHKLLEIILMNRLVFQNTKEKSYMLKELRVLILKKIKAVAD